MNIKSFQNGPILIQAVGNGNKLGRVSHLSLCLLVVCHCLLLLSACRTRQAASVNETVLILTPLPETLHQRVRGFGASDAWSTQFVGTDWPEAAKRQMAEWLFSTGLGEAGQPLGIGLSIWRFNLGAGSAAQGFASGIPDDWRRAESFIAPDGSYDWTAAAGQRWFLKAARDYGVDRLVAFANSPPVQFTRNQRAFAPDKLALNLESDKAGDWAAYIATVLAELEARDGVRFSSVSPFNEPQWDWTNSGQEGTPAFNHEIAAFVPLLAAELDRRELSAMIELPEAAQLNFLYEDHGRPGRGKQAWAFFDPDSPHFLGHLDRVEPVLAAHSYFTTWPLRTMVEARTRTRSSLGSLPANAVSPGPGHPELAITEYCILDNNQEIRGEGRDLGMDMALYVARVIHADLCLADAVSWQWWLAISPYQFKDGLIYIEKERNGGTLEDSKTLWALGNFSRFIRPGMRRIGLDRNDGLSNTDALSGLMGSAWLDEASGAMVLVVVNYGDRERAVRISCPASGPTDGTAAWRTYLTDADHNLAPWNSPGEDEELLVPKRSVLTLVRP